MVSAIWNGATLATSEETVVSDGNHYFPPSAVEFGLRHGAACLLVGGPAMIALMLAGHPWWAAVTLFAVMLGQKLITAPQRWSVAVALGFAAVAVAVAGTAVFD